MNSTNHQSVEESFRRLRLLMLTSLHETLDIQSMMRFLGQNDWAGAAGAGSMETSEETKLIVWQHIISITSSTSLQKQQSWHLHPVAPTKPHGIQFATKDPSSENHLLTITKGIGTGRCIQILGQFQFRLKKCSPVGHLPHQNRGWR